MPELPESEVICEVLQRRVAGQTIREARIIPPGGAIEVETLYSAMRSTLLDAIQKFAWKYRKPLTRNCAILCLCI